MRCEQHAAKILITLCVLLYVCTESDHVSVTIAARSVISREACGVLTERAYAFDYLSIGDAARYERLVLVRAIFILLLLILFWLFGFFLFIHSFRHMSSDYHAK